MKQFDGFPERMQFTPVPNLFFSRLLPEISDISELKTTLHIIGALYQKRGYPRFVTHEELLGNKSLIDSLVSTGKPPDEVLRHALEMAIKRGTILHLALEKDGVPEHVYFLNTGSEREALAKIQRGELNLPGREVKERTQLEVETQPPPDIFTLYEENIGMLTPLIADELREAVKLYPEAWLRDAIKEAANQGKHKWSYIAAILERWSTEGRSSGTYQRDSKKTSPARYIEQKYGHMVRR